MAKRSVEQVKDESDYLRGTLAEQLQQDTESFDDGAKQLLKFHGVYQQDDRDSRKERNREGKDWLYFFMVRSKLPGGKLTADQYLAHDELADRYANGTIRLTSRQGIQFHGVFKRNLKAHIQALNDALISTLAACGDVERNVMCCPAPIRDKPIRDEMQALADRIAEHLCPRTTAYHEIWLNGERAAIHKQGEDVEPIYGKHYLPRKFKTGIALPEDNCIDVLSNDLGLVAIQKEGAIVGYDVYAGGGMGMTHGMEKTYPRLASPLCFATPDDVIDVATAVVKVQRDHGNRQDRKRSRLKYLIDTWGQERFHATVQEYFGKPLAPFSNARIVGIDDHLGWHDQGDGKMWLGVHVLSGRIHDVDGLSLKTALRNVVREIRPSVRISAQQNILLCDIDPQARSRVDQMLFAHGVRPVEQVYNLMRNVMACPSMPTCGLALADSERVVGDMVEGIHAEMERIGIGDEDIVIHMTGCPNGCARPYNADIGVVGRTGGKYTIFLGGNKVGDHIAFAYQDLVPFAEIPTALRGPMTLFRDERSAGEGFGDFCRRVGFEELQRRAGQA